MTKNYKMIRTKDGIRPNYDVVMEKVIGRSIKSTEVVHHIDHNKINDSPDNLFLCESIGLHKSIHQQFRYFAKELAKKLCKLGLIEFDRENALYKLNERIINIFTQKNILNLIDSLHFNQEKLEEIFKKRRKLLERIKRREKEREEYIKSEEYKIESEKVRNLDFKKFIIRNIKN